MPVPVPVPVPVPASVAVAVRVLPEAEWREAERRHAQRVDAWTAAHRERTRSGTPHPVEDFLFTYYSLRPSRLRRWHPGAGVALSGPSARQRLSWRWYSGLPDVPGSRRTGPVVGLDVHAFVGQRQETLRFVRDLLSATTSRAPYLACFGLHEWAMAYRLPEGEQRHAAWPLRLGGAGTDAVVEQHQIRCSHVDAFRFFTVAAAPRNQLRPQRTTQVRLEQPGCLHATMDLYKWAYKLSPAVPSDLLADCFALARDVRAVDMRASPYDLSSLGYEAIRIETPEGKATYVAAQRDLSRRGAVLRTRLLDTADSLAECADSLAESADVSRTRRGRA